MRFTHSPYWHTSVTLAENSHDNEVSWKTPIVNSAPSNLTLLTLYKKPVLARKVFIINVTVITYWGISNFNFFKAILCSFFVFFFFTTNCIVYYYLFIFKTI